MTKIFCTGNVKRKTVAYGLTELFPDTFSASLATGWDFTDNSIIEKFRETILKYDVFVNSAYVNPSVQNRLMDIVFREWMRENIRGHIILVLPWKTQKTKVNMLVLNEVLDKRA